MVRSSRRILRSRSTGVTGNSSDSDKEQRDSLTLASNKTGTTEVDSQLDYNIEAEEKEQPCSQSSDSNTDSRKDHSKSNGSITEKPPSGKRRARSGGQRIHPVITLQAAEDAGTTRLDDGGVDNGTYDCKSEIREESIRCGHRTPPIQEVEMFGSLTSIKQIADDDKHLAVDQFSKKQSKTQSQKTLNTRSNKEQNGTLLRSVIPESKKEASIEETSIEANNEDYDEVTFR